MFTRVLAPLDGSTRGESALPWAMQLAQARGLSLVLCRVVGYPYAAPVPFTGAFVGSHLYDDIVRQEHAAASAYLDDVRQRLGDVPVPVEMVVRAGAAADAILDLADELGAYAIALATRGHGGIGRLMLGSVAEQVLRQATVPILLVPPSSARPVAASISRVLVPLDGSKLAEGALDAARDFHRPGWRMRLVQVVIQPRGRGRSGTAGTAEQGEAGTLDELQAAVSRAREYLDQVASSFDQGVGDVVTSVLHDESPGDVSRRIVAAARQESMDLVVMSSHGRTGVTRWRLGSVADEVVRHADRPILLVSGRAVAARAARQVVVDDVMTPDVTAVRDDELLGVAIRKLVRRGVSGAPVVDRAGQVIGVVSERDLLARQERVLEMLAPDSGVSAAEYIRQLAGEKVRSLMSQPPKTVDASASLRHASTVFREAGVRRLPVMSDGRLVGILTRGDLLRAMAAQIEAMSADGGPEPAEEQAAMPTGRSDAERERRTT